MTGRFLLDTNIVIALFAQDTSVEQHIASAEAVFVPSTVIGELYYGAHKSSQVKANLARIYEFATNSIVLACDTETARHYGQLKNLLRTKGRPIPENDIWIAAVAQQYQLILLSRDGHFREIDTLSVETW